MARLETYEIGSSLLTYDLIEKILKDKSTLILSADAKEKIQKCRDYLDKKEEDLSKPIYGVTTGFG